MFNYKGRRDTTDYDDRDDLREKRQDRRVSDGGARNPVDRALDYDRNGRGGRGRGGYRDNDDGFRDRYIYY